MSLCMEVARTPLISRRAHRYVPRLAAPVFAFFLSVIFSGEASAHVKWFCAFNCAGQPRGLEKVLCSEFELLVGLAMLSLAAGCLLEGTAVGDALQRALNWITSGLQSNTEILIRVVCGFFFVGVWSKGGILLWLGVYTTLGASSCMHFVM